MKTFKILTMVMLLFFISNCKSDKKNIKIEESKEKTIEVVKNLDYHLANGLKEIENGVGIEQKFTNDVYLRKFAFYEKAENRYDLILELQDDITNEIISKYTFAIEGFVVEEEKEYLSDYAKLKNRMHEAWFASSPNVIKSNNHSYVIVDVTTKIFEFKLIKFFLYDRDGYKGDIGERILYNDYLIK